MNATSQTEETFTFEEVLKLLDGPRGQAMTFVSDSDPEVWQASVRRRIYTDQDISKPDQIEVNVLLDTRLNLVTKLRIPGKEVSLMTLPSWFRRGPDVFLVPFVGDVEFEEPGNDYQSLT